MDQTFPFRRQDLLNHLTVQDLLSIYPPLKDPEEVRKHCEMFRGVIITLYYIACL